MEKVAILGAGAAGLSAGFYLSKQGIPFQIFEKETYIGGLARSFNWHGFDCDFAAHRFYTNDEEVLRAAFQLVPMLRHYRRSKLYVKGSWLNDPINPAELARVIPLSEALRMARELAAPDADTRQARSFQDYILAKYGQYMFEAFFRPYTEKMFGIPSDQISVLWAEKKTRLVNPFKRTDVRSKRFFSYFYYPIRGGYGSISHALYEPIAAQVHLGCQVSAILTTNGRVSGIEYLEGGKPHTFECDTIISTLPLPTTAHLAGFDASLRYNKVDAVYLWVDKPFASPYHWVYFIDENICINRMVEFKQMSPYNSPEETTVLCAEVTQKVLDPAGQVIADLERTGFLEPGKVKDTLVIREPYSYPVYEVGYEKTVQAVTDQLSEIDGLYLFGRNAEFTHYEVDDLLGGGKRLVERLLEKEGKEIAAVPTHEKKAEKTCIVILSYNNSADTLECLDSLQNLKGGPLPTYLVDNGSTDDTLVRVQAEFPQVRILAQSANLGVPRGFNKGVYQALADGFDYILILNNDTVADPALVEELHKVALQDPDCAVVMPRIYYYPPRQGPLSRQDVWADGGYYRTFPPAIKLKDNRQHIDFSKPRQVDYVPTCGLLFHRRAFENAGLFDEGYFLFYEDWDFSERLRQAGLTLWSAPEAVLWHKVSRSTAKNMSFYWQKRGESAMRFFRRHHTKFSTSLQMGYFYLRDFLLKPANLKYLPDYRAGIRSGRSAALENYPDLATMLRNDQNGE